MNTKATLFGLAITSVVALMVSCSGGTDSNDNPAAGSHSGGSAGKGGSSSAGTSSSGSSSGGTGNNGGSANNNGGSRNGGGNATGGGFNLGGAGLDPADYMCNPVPQTGSACTAGTQPCLDGTSVCYCQANKWACNDFGGGLGGAGPGGGLGELDCPATQPTDGASCGDTVGVCPYGQNMGCACYMGMWTCF